MATPCAFILAAGIAVMTKTRVIACATPGQPLLQRSPISTARSAEPIGPGSILGRKSDGWGKSVSVSVDLGGRRTITKKNTTHIPRHIDRIETCSFQVVSHT